MSLKEAPASVSRMKPVAQRQDVVIGTLALLWQLLLKLIIDLSRAADPKGTKSCRTQGESVRTYIRPSVRPSVRPCVHAEGSGWKLNERRAIHLYLVSSGTLCCFQIW